MARKERELEAVTKFLQAAKSTYVFKSIKNEFTPPQISGNPPLFGVDSWKAKKNEQIARGFNAAMTKMENHCAGQVNQAVNAVKKELVVDYERLGQLELECSRLIDENQALSADLANSLAIMANDTARRLVLHVATLLLNEEPVPSTGGGGGSESDLPWDGRKRDEDEEAYRHRCLLAAMQHVAKMMPKKGRKR